MSKVELSGAAKQVMAESDIPVRDTYSGPTPTGGFHAGVLLETWAKLWAHHATQKARDHKEPEIEKELSKRVAEADKYEADVKSAAVCGRIAAAKAADGAWQAVGVYAASYSPKKKKEPSELELQLARLDAELAAMDKEAEMKRHIDDFQRACVILNAATQTRRLLDPEFYCATCVDLKPPFQHAYCGVCGAGLPRAESKKLDEKDAATLIRARNDAKSASLLYTSSRDKAEAIAKELGFAHCIWCVEPPADDTMCQHCGKHLR